MLYFCMYSFATGYLNYFHILAIISNVFIECTNVFEILISIAIDNKVILLVILRTTILFSMADWLFYITAAKYKYSNFSTFSSAFYGNSYND
jgi:hypothetical protein